MYGSLKNKDLILRASPNSFNNTDLLYAGAYDKILGSFVIWGGLVPTSGERFMKRLVSDFH